MSRGRHSRSATAPVTLSAGRQRAVLAILVVAQLIVWLDNTILNVALKTLADPVKGVGATPSQLEWSISSYTLVFAAMLFTGGTLGDRWGRRLVLILGLAVFGGGSVWAAYAGTAQVLIAARACMGVGSALVMPATLSIITNVFDARQRAQAIAIWSGFSGLAIAIGPLLGGALLEHYWWGSIFLVNVPVAVLGIVGALAVIPETRNPVPRRLDPLGLALSMAGLFSLVYGVIRGGQLGDWGGAEVWGPVLAGAAVLTVFVLVELRVAEPCFDARLFRSATFTASSSAVMLTFFGLMGSMFYAIFYLQGVRGLSPLHSGVTLLPVAIGVLIGAPASERLVRLTGLRSVTSVALTVVVGTFLGYGLLETDTPLWKYGVLLALQGVAMGAVMAPTTEAIMDNLPRERSGGGSAISTSLRQVGGVLGVAVLGSVLSTAYRTAIDPALHGLPRQLADPARVSAEATRLVAGRLRSPQLARAADTAYVHAMHVTTVWAALVSSVGIVILLAALPRSRRAAAVLLPREPAVTREAADHPITPVTSEARQ